MKKLTVILCLFSLGALAKSFSDGLSLYDAGKHEQAYKVWHELAKAGQANSQHNLAVMLEKGIGVKKDEAAAFNWFEKAAKQGHAKAQYTLGSKYFFGKKQVKRDFTKAIYWWEKAAEQGQTSASYNLGALYLYAGDKFKDKTKAVKWLKQAASSGHKKAKAELEKLGVKLLSDKTQKSEINKFKPAEKSEKAKKSVAKTKSADKKPEPLSKDTGINEKKTKAPVKKTESVSTLGKDASQAAAKTTNKTKLEKSPDVDVKTDKQIKPGMKLVYENKKQDSKKSDKTQEKSQASQSAKPKAIAKKKVKTLKAKADWFARQNKNHYTIQLAVVDTRKKAAGFVKQYKLKAKARYYKIKKKKLYKIISGSYPSIKKAQTAIRKLPSSLRKQGAWPKKFSVVLVEKE